MSSPFPGVDPFVEGPDWEDFHHTFITELKAALVPLVRPKYVVRSELRVYQQAEFDDGQALTKPDVGIYQTGSATTSLQSSDSLEPDPPLVALLPLTMLCVNVAWLRTRKPPPCPAAVLSVMKLLLNVPDQAVNTPPPLPPLLLLLIVLLVT